MAQRLTYAEWKREVDKTIAAKVGGLISDDLPDYWYAKDYEEGRKPQWSATAAIKAAKRDYGFC